MLEPPPTSTTPPKKKKKSYKKLLQQITKPSAKGTHRKCSDQQQLKRSGLGGGTFSKIDKI